jgi:hypothetical protein
VYFTIGKRYEIWKVYRTNDIIEEFSVFDDNGKLEYFYFDKEEIDYYQNIFYSEIDIRKIKLNKLKKQI